MVSTLARVRVKAIYFVEKNYVDTSTTPFLKNCHLSSRKILDIILFSKFQGVFPLLRTALLLIFFEKESSSLYTSKSNQQLVWQNLSLQRKKRGWGKNPQISVSNITTSDVEFVTHVTNGICVKYFWARVKLSRINAILSAYLSR